MRIISSKKELILDATIKLISKKNSFDVTIREIAKEAKVNVAAINYYFKSKNELFAEMQNMFLENFADAFTPLDDENLSNEEKLDLWLKKAIGYANHYPGILVYLKDMFSNPKDSLFENAMREGLIIRLLEIRQLLLDVISPSPEDEEDLFMTFAACLILPFVLTVVMDESIPKNDNDHINFIMKTINKYKVR